MQLGVAVAEQQLECKGGGNLTEVLCSRLDTSVMCSLLRPPATVAVAPPHWSLDSPQTILVMPDVALHRARRMRFIDATGQPAMHLQHTQAWPSNIILKKIPLLRTHPHTHVCKRAPADAALFAEWSCIMT